MPLSKPTASNEADWREARLWLREMAGMGLHRIESIMDGMTLIFPTKLESKISTQAKSLIETVTAACAHSRINLCGGVIYMEISKQLHAGTIQAYDALDTM